MVMGCIVVECNVHRQKHDENAFAQTKDFANKHLQSWNTGSKGYERGRVIAEVLFSGRGLLASPATAIASLLKGGSDRRTVLAGSVAFYLSICEMF